MQDSRHNQEQSAKHLAARAVIAYRAGFPISLLSTAANDERSSGIVCNWKSLRDSLQNDTKLLGRAFAFVYVGSIVDQALKDPISDDLRKELVADMSSALDARQTAVDWGVVDSVIETNPFAHIGYKLASRLLKVDGPLIESLTATLNERATIQGDALREWFNANASPLDLDALEASTTF